MEEGITGAAMVEDIMAAEGTLGEVEGPAPEQEEVKVVCVMRYGGDVHDERSKITGIMLLE
jgi:hypothetical protein